MGWIALFQLCVGKLGLLQCEINLSGDWRASGTMAGIVNICCRSCELIFFFFLSKESGWLGG